MVSQKSCTVFLVVVAAVCLQLYQAHDFLGRCLCPVTVKFVKGNISDFQVLEKHRGCDKTELIITMTKADNATEQICMNTEGKMAKVFLKCWERINKDKNRKMECINRITKTE